MAHQAHSHAAHGHGPVDDADQAEILDLDAEVLGGHLAEITGWLPVAEPPQRIVDLGAGTGAGTLALAERFPRARILAVDSSSAHLRRLEEKAAESGAAARVRTVVADLDAAWPDLGAPDLVWASASMHHMADPDRALRAVHALLPQGGLFAVVELAGFPRFLPDTEPAESPGLEERLHEALDLQFAEHVPHRGADWGPLLTSAGFTIEAEHAASVRLTRTDSDAIPRYAHRSLTRMRTAAAGLLDPADLAALDRLLPALASHPALELRTTRTTWAART